MPTVPKSVTILDTPAGHRDSQKEPRCVRRWDDQAGMTGERCCAVLRRSPPRSASAGFRFPAEVISTDVRGPAVGWKTTDLSESTAKFQPHTWPSVTGEERVAEVRTAVI